ncbi:hypothetical protein SAMN05443549_104266 [Flavobacterium fluvii]|uniref:CAAX protease self-immunity n=1 Tax=Flavobacterium fluvii TaxID=468056 RepID=A0A1M5KD90_9FLAO|nr:hypothetical protein SAMN05443549_104266 [Flavobacterium fluvii]
MQATDSLVYVFIYVLFLFAYPLYVLVHIFNSKKGILACIPFGLMVCFFSITFNSSWPAILLHIVFSSIYELNFCRLNLINPKTVKS